MYRELEITMKKSVDIYFKEELRKTSEYPELGGLGSDTCKTPVSLAKAELALSVQCHNQGCRCVEL
jgi:hypothetical protein